MSKNVWGWGINYNGDKGYWIDLHKHSTWAEIKSAFGGWLLNHSWFGWQYRLADRFILAAYNDRIEVMSLPITEEQARELGWDGFME